jgi:lipopolysaccharide/colanic/teichoic acid biosynthesis glycosyltransferase
MVPDYFDHKAIGMRVFGATLLVVFLPIMLVCMLLVRLTSPGQAIYRQTRVGKNDQLFKLYKIRTMYANCENVSGPVLCQPGDSRVTPVGRVLRFLHLDELPQLINVARGEMCLVGPRPERPEIIMRHKLKENVPGFADRTKVLPGVTGLAQINLPADISVDCVKPKVQLDLEYIETASWGMDLRVLLCTAFRMIGVRHGRAVRLFGLVRGTAVHLGTAPSPHGAPTLNGKASNGVTLGHIGNGASRLAVVSGDEGAGNGLEWRDVAGHLEGTLPKQPR